MTRSTRWRRMALVLCALAAAGCGSRPPVRTFAELPQRVRPGHTVYVIDVAGRETGGKLAALSSSELTVNVDGAPTAFTVSQIRQVQRYGDSLWNGFIIGAAIALPGTLIGDSPYGPCEHDRALRCARSKVPQQLFGIGLFGAIGAGIDAMMRSRQQVYLAPDASPAGDRLKIAPLVRPDGAGVVLQIPSPRRRARD